jgi:hypothetical protein
VIVLENQPYDAIIGSSQARPVHQPILRVGAALRRTTTTSRTPSAPEYLAATSGELGGAGDCPPVFLDPSWPPTCRDTNDNIFQQTMAAGETWKN